MGINVQRKQPFLQSGKASGLQERLFYEAMAKEKKPVGSLSETGCADCPAALIVRLR